MQSLLQKLAKLVGRTTALRWVQIMRKRQYRRQTPAEGELPLRCHCDGQAPATTGSTDLPLHSAPTDNRAARRADV